MSVIERLQDLTNVEKVAGMQTFGALCVLGGTATFAAFKLGEVQQFFPPDLRKKVNGWIDKLAKATAPEDLGTAIGNRERHRVNFLSRVYASASLGFVIGGLGSMAWLKCPWIPITPCIIASGSCFAASAIMARRFPKGKTIIPRALFGASCFTGGMALAPMNYIGSNAFTTVLFSMALSTTASFAVAPRLCRGWLATGFLAQVLSSSVCHVAAKSLVLGTFDNVDTRIDFDRGTISENVLELCVAPVKVEALLFTQFLFNAALSGLHIYPVLSGVRDEDVDHGEASELRDALFITGSFSAAVVKLFQMCCSAIGRSLNSAAKKKKEAEEKQLKKIKSSMLEVDPIPFCGSMAAFMYLYIKVVNRIQRSDDITGYLRVLRWIFSILSPVKIVNRFD